MSSASSEDARDRLSSLSVPPSGAARELLDSYLSHLAHVGDEMATGLGGLFADTFPEVPTLDEIEVGFTFSKKDAAHLAASLDVPYHEHTCLYSGPGLK